MGFETQECLCLRLFGTGREAWTLASASILYPEGVCPDDRPPQFLTTLADLNLDQLVEFLAEAPEADAVRAVFSQPLRRADVVTFRQGVFRALEGPPWRPVADAFADAMRAVRRALETAASLHNPRQQDWWRLEAMHLYTEAVAHLDDAASGTTAGTCAGLDAVADYVHALRRGGPFAALATEVSGLREELATVRYAVRIRGSRVTVLPYDDEDDVSAAVARTFAPFRGGPAQDYRMRLSAPAAMNHVEGEILERVAALFPNLFRRLAALRGQDPSDASFVDPVLSAFDRDLCFYLRYLAYLEPVREVGLATCYPEAVDSDGACTWRDGFDLVLAHALALEGRAAVASDFDAAPMERAFVITGPNHGGKTTFARALGQLHVLTALGCPVPGSEARVGPLGPVFTHFERAEQVGEDARSRLEDEIVRIREILSRATPETLIVINEMLAGTTLGDAARLGRRVMERLRASGARFLWVTFIEDLAVAPGAVSLAAVNADDLTPTFRVERRRPDGVAHALALARRHGLDPASLRGVLET